MLDHVPREQMGKRPRRLADTAWCGICLARRNGKIRSICKSATKDEIAQHGYVLTPGRYVGAEEVEDNDEPFDEKMRRLVEELTEQFAESGKLEQAIRANLKGLGYGR